MVKIKNIEKNMDKNEKTKDQLQILYSNIDGLANKIDELEMRINVDNPDVVLLCETKLDDSIGNEGLPKEFQILRKDRVGSKGRGGGLCFLVKNELNPIERKDIMEN